MQLYEIYPIIEGEFTFPITCEPVPLKGVGPIIIERMRVIEMQGFWRNCRGEHIPINQVGFKVVPATHYEDEEDEEDNLDEAGQLNGAWHP
jgi:hypothetical protein